MNTLKFGDSGLEVEKLQNQLNKLGFDSGSVDGNFGQKTKLAVEEFQKRKGLSVDGTAGSVTLDELFNPSNNLLTLGIDVSQGSVDWQAVKNANISFAFAKATEGGDWPSKPPENSWFEINWPQMKQVGLIRGAYHFFQPLTDVQTQVNNFLKKVHNVIESNDFPPILDVEDFPDYMQERWGKINLDERIGRIKQWLQIVQEKTGRSPIIYTNPNFWKGYMQDTEEFTNYLLWIADYDALEPKIPANNWGGKGYAIWQNTEHGIVDGISGHVDRNRFNGSGEELIALVKSTEVA